jgi:hypothetical protein
MTELYFKNVKTDRRYKVMRIDKEKGEITLKGEYSEFTEPYDKERFKRLGYVLEKVESEDDDDA